MKKERQHYKLLDGTLVAGVTTILQVMAKPALIPWAWKLGKNGVDYREHLDEKANIGTLAHEMILAYYKNEPRRNNAYSQEESDQALVCFEKFTEWESQHNSKPILIEGSMVSEIFKYGGTPDFYGEIDGKLTLLDFKTNPNVYDEMKIQLSAYYMLLREHKKKVEKAGIINIPIEGKKAKETFISLDKLEVGFQIFKHCLEIYNLKRRLK